MELKGIGRTCLFGAFGSSLQAWKKKNMHARADRNRVKRYFIGYKSR